MRRRPSTSTASRSAAVGAGQPRPYSPPYCRRRAGRPETDALLLAVALPRRSSRRRLQMLLAPRGSVHRGDPRSRAPAASTAPVEVRPLRPPGRSHLQGVHGPDHRRAGRRQRIRRLRRGPAAVDGDRRPAHAAVEGVGVVKDGGAEVRQLRVRCSRTDQIIAVVETGRARPGGREAVHSCRAGASVSPCR